VLTVTTTIIIRAPELLLSRPIPAGGAFVASDAEFKAWLQRAEAGDRCVYARAAHLPNGCAVGEAARGFAAAGAVTLTRGRFAPGSPLFEFFAKRTSFPLAAEAPAPSDDALHPDERRLLEVLVEHADRGEPCPSNRVLARLALLAGVEQASYRIRCLRDKGAILVRPVPLDPGRVVTIVATGARTGFGREAAA
jgi:hypothetical protein